MHISIDSRVMKGNDLFVPLIGEKTDAHDFIGQALENGAAAVLTSRHSQMESHCPWIQVEDTRKALQAIGSWYRARLSLPLIGVTGSVGKTTAREMVAAALSARYKVYKTPGNSNSQVGVPITVSEITGEDEIGVIELGMSLPGEMERHGGKGKPGSHYQYRPGPYRAAWLKGKYLPGKAPYPGRDGGRGHSLCEWG